MLDMLEKIVGERIYLQRHAKTIAHAGEMLALVQKSLPELKKWLPWAIDDYNLEKSYEFLITADTLWNSGEGYVYGIHLPDGKCIGNISIQGIKYKDKNGEIGYWMATPYAGNGYMQEAVRLLEKEGFAAGLHRIFIRADILNDKSCSVAQKCGYIYEGTMMGLMYASDENRYRDIKYFAKLAK